MGREFMTLTARGFDSFQTDVGVAVADIITVTRSADGDAITVHGQTPEGTTGLPAQLFVRTNATDFNSKGSTMGEFHDEFEIVQNGSADTVGLGSEVTLLTFAPAAPATIPLPAGGFSGAAVIVVIAGCRALRSLREREK